MSCQLNGCKCFLSKDNHLLLSPFLNCMFCQHISSVYWIFLTTEIVFNSPPCPSVFHIFSLDDFCARLVPFSTFRFFFPKVSLTFCYLSHLSSCIEFLFPCLCIMPISCFTVLVTFNILDCLSTFFSTLVLPRDHPLVGLFILFHILLQHSQLSTRPLYKPSVTWLHQAQYRAWLSTSQSQCWPPLSSYPTTHPTHPSQPPPPLLTLTGFFPPNAPAPYLVFTVPTTCNPYRHPTVLILHTLFFKLANNSSPFRLLQYTLTSKQTPYPHPSLVTP